MTISDVAAKIDPNEARTAVAEVMMAALGLVRR